MKTVSGSWFDCKCHSTTYALQKRLPRASGSTLANTLGCPAHPAGCSGIPRPSETDRVPRGAGLASHLGRDDGAGQAAPRFPLRLRGRRPFVWSPPLSPWLLIISIFLVFQTNKCHYQAVGSSRRLQALPFGLN